LALLIITTVIICCVFNLSWTYGMPGICIERHIVANVFI